MSEPAKFRRHRSVLVRHPDHVHAIGMITVEVSNLDIILGEMLGGILRISPDFSRIIDLTPHSAFGRLEVLENAANASLTPDSEGLAHVKSLIGRARTIAGKRQHYIHHAWVVRKGTSEVHQAKLVTEPATLKPVELTTLKDLIRDIRNLCDDVRLATLRMYADSDESELRKLFPAQFPTNDDQKDQN